MIHHIPLHPISLKIILTDYENLNPDPNSDFPFPMVEITSRDLLFDHLRFRYAATRKKLLAIRQKLTARLSVKMNAPIHNPHHIGYYLYKLHKDQIFRFAHAQVLAGGEATAGIKMCCAMYGIDDDDIDIDSLGREFRRYKRKKIHLFDQNIRINKQRKRTQYFEKTKLLVPLDKSEIHNLVSSTVTAHLDDFITGDDTFDKSMVLQALSYSYYHLGFYIQTEIAKMENVAKSTVNYRIQQWGNILSTHDGISKTYHEEVKQRL